jgi:type II secretory pathway pseudopilin PulG
MQIIPKHSRINGTFLGASKHLSSVRGFTMVEVALSIAIVAFAMVAIIGIMPTGFEAQRLNREETVINQDGTLFMEAIRNGALGFNELTNFVDSITISNHMGNVRSIGVAENARNFADAIPLTNSHFILGMLSTPQLEVVDVRRNGAVIYSTNEVSAMVRAISGSAGQRFQVRDFQENSFSYLLSTKILPYLPSPTNSFGQGSVPITTNRYSLAVNVATNLYDVQLKFRWPVTKVQTGSSGRPDIQYRIGKYEKIFRTLVSGRLLSTNGAPFLRDNDRRNDVPLYYFNSKDYTPPAL